jgi:glycosyltransferase involved in cell wall biosynthesis
MAKKVLIFFPHELRERHGGPYSYLFHLKEGLKNLSHSIFFLGANVAEISGNESSNQNISLLKKFVAPFIPGKWKNNYRAKKWFKQLENEKPVVNAKYINGFDILHFHETIDIWRYKNLLENYKGKIFLTSHTPKPYHLELLEDVWKLSANNFSKDIVNRITMIDRFAFERTDEIVSACKEATESYSLLWPEFVNIIRHKKFHFIPTGIKKQIAAMPASVIRKQFNIPATAFVFCFTGRKSDVKGFDLLIAASKKILDKNKDVYFFVVGVKEPLPAIDNPRWIETGWTGGPESFMAASDIIVAPNRHTWFDLSVLESLSLGKPLLLSDTGGNKHFKQFNAPGIIYHQPNTDSLLSEMTNCLNQKEKLAVYGLQNEAIYENNFRCEKFAGEMIKLYDSID